MPKPPTPKKELSPIRTRSGHIIQDVGWDKPKSEGGHYGYLEPNVSLVNDNYILTIRYWWNEGRCRDSPFLDRGEVNVERIANFNPKVSNNVVKIRIASMVKELLIERGEWPLKDPDTKPEPPATIFPPGNPSVVVNNTANPVNNNTVNVEINWEEKAREIVSKRTTKQQRINGKEAEVIRNLHKEGYNQTNIAEMLGRSWHCIGKRLNKDRNN